MNNLSAFLKKNWLLVTILTLGLIIAAVSLLASNLNLGLTSFIPSPIINSGKEISGVIKALSPNCGPSDSDCLTEYQLTDKNGVIYSLKNNEGQMIDWSSYLGQKVKVSGQIVYVYDNGQKVMEVQSISNQ